MLDSQPERRRMLGTPARFLSPRLPFVLTPITREVLPHPLEVSRPP